jgi:hypothetical protein
MNKESTQGTSHEMHRLHCHTAFSGLSHLDLELKIESYYLFVAHQLIA